MTLKSGKPPFEPFYIYILLFILVFFTSDVLITSIRGLMLPTQAPPVRAKNTKKQQQKNLGDYGTITRRNIFNSDGVIPPTLYSMQNAEPSDDAPAVLSNLPLRLVGTIVHANPARSVATVQNRSSNKIKSYRVGKTIDDIAELILVERKKLIFRNTNNGRKEYIEIKDDLKINFGLNEATSDKVIDKEVQRNGNQFTLKREDVLKYTKNLPDLLQQARAVPNIIPGSGGQADGFRILEMKKGSIFEKLGIQRLDVIKGINGEPIDSPAKAMELYNALKSSSNIELEIERNGRNEKFDYSIQ